MVVDSRLIEHIYEAALVPEAWIGALDALGEFSGSAGGSLFVAAEGRPRSWVASDGVAARLAAFTETGAWRSNRRRALWAAAGGGFRRDVDIFTSDELARPEFQTHGLGFQVGSVIPMPTGEQVIITMERHRADGPHGPKVAAALDRLRPHLARAGLLAARLGLERARTAVATLEAVGLPAAVLTSFGRVLAVNARLEACSPSLLLATAHGGLAIADAAAHELLRRTMADAEASRGPVIRSIPVAAKGDRAAAVVHLIPVRGAAHDIFSGAATLLVITGIGV